jgi:hypothetical protein
MATGAAPSLRQIQILPLNQYGLWTLTFEMKQLHITDLQEVLKTLSLYRQTFLIPVKNVAVVQKYSQFLY